MKHIRPISRLDHTKESAKALLLETLKAGRVPVENIRVEAAQAGVSASALHRAKAALGIKSIRAGQGAETVWYWELSEQKGDQS